MCNRVNLEWNSNNDIGIDRNSNIIRYLIRKMDAMFGLMFRNND